jgi:hypothetical protein
MIQEHTFKGGDCEKGGGKVKGDVWNKNQDILRKCKCTTE